MLFLPSTAVLVCCMIYTEKLCLSVSEGEGGLSPYIPPEAARIASSQFAHQNTTPRSHSPKGQGSTQHNSKGSQPQRPRVHPAQFQRLTAFMAQGPTSTTRTTHSTKGQGSTQHKQYYELTALRAQGPPNTKRQDLTAPREGLGGSQHTTESSPGLVHRGTPGTHRTTGRRPRPSFLRRSLRRERCKLLRDKSRLPLQKSINE